MGEVVPRGEVQVAVQAQPSWMVDGHQAPLKKYPVPLPSCVLTSSILTFDLPKQGGGSPKPTVINQASTDLQPWRLARHIEGRRSLRSGQAGSWGQWKRAHGVGLAAGSQSRPAFALYARRGEKRPLVPIDGRVGGWACFFYQHGRQCPVHQGNCLCPVPYIL